MTIVETVPTETGLEYARRVLMFYAHYCGRFDAVCTMLRQPGTYDHELAIEQLLMIQDDYLKEREGESDADSIQK